MDDNKTERSYMDTANDGYFYAINDNFNKIRLVKVKSDKFIYYEQDNLFSQKENESDLLFLGDCKIVYIHHEKYYLFDYSEAKNEIYLKEKNAKKEYLKTLKDFGLSVKKHLIDLKKQTKIYGLDFGVWDYNVKTGFSRRTANGVQLYSWFDVRLMMMRRFHNKKQVADFELSYNIHTCGDMLVQLDILRKKELAIRFRETLLEITSILLILSATITPILFLFFA